MIGVYVCRLRYGHGRVRDISELKSYEVQFEDGTICSDMAREDLIVSHAREGPVFFLLLQLCAGNM